MPAGQLSLDFARAYAKRDPGTNSGRTNETHVLNVCRQLGHVRAEEAFHPRLHVLGHFLPLR
eukprot:7124496-Prorocentrum_lima.AAC.1